MATQTPALQITASAPVAFAVLVEYKLALGRIADNAHTALCAGDMEEHMRQGAAYHALADAILQAHGVEMRPAE